MNKNSRILITGGTGLIGRHIVMELLHRGYHNLEIFSRSGFKNDKYLTRKNIIDTRGDVVELYPLQDRIAAADAVIHCAAIVSFDPKLFKKMRSVNVEGTANVMDLCLSENVKKAIHISSVAAIGRDEKSDTIDENTKWKDSKYNSYYGITKHLAEQEAWRALHEGLRLSIINPSIVFGDGDWTKSSLQIFKKVYKGIPYYPSGSTAIVDAKDVAKIVVTALENDIFGERYIAAGTNISYQDLFKKMARVLNVKAPQKVAPKLALSLIWRIEYIRSKLFGSEPLITRESVISTAHKSVYDNRKSLTLGWGSYVNIDDTIKQYGESFLEHMSQNSDYTTEN